MSEISELESRIVAAIGRIRTAIEAQNTASAGVDQTELEDHVSVLEAERDAARMAADTTATALEAAQAQIGTLEQETTALRETVQQLQSVNAELRGAATETLGDADAINKALAADLAALQEARAADLKDIEALLAQVEQTAGEAGHA